MAANYTNREVVAALAAFYLKIPVGHVEAGLRTRDKHRPFPEEGTFGNRYVWPKPILNSFTQMRVGRPICP